MLYHTFIEWLFGFSYKRVQALLAALHCIPYVVHLAFRSFVLAMSQFLSARFATSEVHWDAMLGENFQ